MEVVASAQAAAPALPVKTPPGPEDAPEIVGQPVTLEDLVGPKAASASQADKPQTELEAQQVEAMASDATEKEDATPEQATAEEATAEEVTEAVAIDMGDAAASSSADAEVAVATPVNVDANGVVDDDDDDDDEDEFHEPITDDFLDDEEDEDPEGDLAAKLALGQSAAGVPPTLSFSVNEMEVVTNRGGRSGSLSKFLDDADSFRRRSLPSYPDDALFGLGHKKMTLAAFLDMAIDPVLEILEDTDSDIRLWLMQADTVKEVLAEFVTPPVLEGEPHEEYGYYKKHFLCSEIIMKLYTGEEDLYESFSSDSSSGSAATTAVFGCQEQADLDKWALLYSIFDNPVPLDEMQLLFFSKALVRLHDGFCLEEGYVPNVLKRFLPSVVPHLYSNTIKYMLTLILQSYESVHPITGRNDAMEIAAPLLASATRLDVAQPENLPLVENTSNLLVDMLQANQADRLGAFCRREGGVYLSKYFVRDQFGTIRGFESMTHGYHNFLQYMLLEELAKHPTIVDDLFANACHELGIILDRQLTEASSAMNVHVVTELLVLCTKLYSESSDDDDDNQKDEDSIIDHARGSFGYSGFDQFPSSPRESSTDTAMYNLSSVAGGRALWSYVREVAKRTAPEFVARLNKGLPSSVEISLAKYLHTLVALNDAGIDEQLHTAQLIPTYLNVIKTRPSFDMLLIHIVPSISFILRDADGSRAKNCPLTSDLFQDSNSLLDVLMLAKSDIPTFEIYAAILQDVIDELFTLKTPTENNRQVLFHCKRSTAWQQLVKLSGGEVSRASDERRSSVKDPSAATLEEQVLGTEQPDLAEINGEINGDRVSQQQDEDDDDEMAPVMEADDDEEDEGEVDFEASPEKEEASPEAVDVKDRQSLKEKLQTESEVAKSSADEPVADNQQEETKATTVSTSAEVIEVTAERRSSKPPLAEKSKPDEEENTTSRDSEGTTRRSTLFKQVLQSPVFKAPMRLGGVIKTPSPQPANVANNHSNSNGTDSTEERGPRQATRSNSFGWNSMFKRLRKSLVTNHTDKPDKKLLALSNEPFAAPPSVAPRQTDVLVVDTSRGEDVSLLVHRDGGVNVADVPVPSAKGVGAMNVVTAGYMYKSKFPETGQRHLWERYYFVLDRLDGALSFYISETHAKDRTFVRGTSRPVSVSEGIPVHVGGQRTVYGFQINTQGHGSFMVLVDSIDSRLTWLTEIVASVAAANPPQGSASQKRLSLVNDDAMRQRLSVGASLEMSKAELKGVVVEFYKNLFGPNLKFSSPLDAPASFWMEEKIDPVSDACVLSSNLPDCVPYWGEFHGYKRLCDYWKTRDETVERSAGRVLRIVVDEQEQTAVVMTSTTFRILRNSEIITEESCDIVSLTAGAIVSIHCTFDSFRIAEAFRKEGVSAS